MHLPRPATAKHFTHVLRVHNIWGRFGMIAMTGDGHFNEEAALYWEAPFVNVHKDILICL